MAPEADVGHLWIVDGNGGGDFIDIATAVAEAVDGDTILVRPLLEEDAAYAPFTIDDKDLRVVAEMDSVPVVESCEVRNLSDWKQVVISHILFDPSLSTSCGPEIAIRIDACEGSVRLNQCIGKFAEQGLIVRDSLDVVADGCSFGGLDVQEAETYIQNSRVATWYTGSGAWSGSLPYTLKGCAGMLVDGSEVWVESGGLSGAAGGDACPGSTCPQGGPGLSLVGVGAVHASQDTYMIGGIGGYGGWYLGCVRCGDHGVPYEVEDGSSLDFHSTPLPRILAKTAVEAGGMYDLAISGLPGARVFLRRSSRTDFQVVSAEQGIDFIGSTIGFDGIDLGVIPDTGILRKSLPVHKLLAYSGVGNPWAGKLARTLYLQPHILGGDGQPVYGNVMAVTIYAKGIIEDLPHPQRLYVDIDAPPGGDGLSWATAYQYPWDAIQPLYLQPNPYPGRTVEIWVAEGLYRGQEHWHGINISGPITVLGGFKGDETDRDARNPELHPVVISGDVNGDDTVSGDNRDDNLLIGADVRFGSYSGVRLHEPPRIEGITLQGYTLVGCRMGGGVVRNCVIQDCARGAELLSEGSFEGCRILRCGLQDANADGAVRVRAPWIHSYQILTTLYGPDPGRARIVNCQIIGNEGSEGGGVTIEDGVDASVVRCLEVVNCEFNHNNGLLGGAIYAAEDEWSAYRLLIENCTFFDNRAAPEWSAGGFFNHNGLSQSAADFTVQIRNSIFWSNWAGNSNSEFAQIGGDSWDPAVYSVQANCIMGYATMGGEGNIPDHPKFEDIFGQDGIPGTGDEDLSLMIDSPCVDAGWNSLLPADWLDLDGDGDWSEALPVDLRYGERRLDGERQDTGMGTPPIVDMGAYERHPTGLTGR